MPEQTYANFLKDPDQVSRRAEIAAFVGPNAAKFLKAYDAQVATAQRQPGEKVRFSFGAGWVWPAFFIGPVWFFYRRMWGWAWGLTVAMIVVSLLPVTSRLGVGFGAAMGGTGGLLYVGHAVKTIERLRAQSPGGVLDPQSLAAAGGVSKTAAWVAGGVLALLVIGGVAVLVILGSSGSPAMR